MALQKAEVSIIIFFFLLVTLTCPFAASSFLIPASPVDLHYHKGPILGDGAPIKLYLTFYGEFTAADKTAIVCFLESISGESAFSHIAAYTEPGSKLAVKLSRKYASEFIGSGSASTIANSVKAPTALLMEDGPPTVAEWWSLTGAYTDSRGNRVSKSVQIEHEGSDNYSRGKLLSWRDVEWLAKSGARRAAAAADGGGGGGRQGSRLHVILTAADVGVEGFCMHACGKHGHTEMVGGGEDEVAYAWVGNAGQQCPGYCAWPFVRAMYGPNVEPVLQAPNGADVDGMIINLAKVLVGAATNPYGNGYYVGSGSAGVDAAGVCTGSYGPGAFPGYPGRALRDPVTRASYNVNGLYHSRFLLPYIWNPATRSCAVHP